MFSRTECGPDFVVAFGDGRLQWEMADEGSQYDHFFTHVRLGSPSNRRAATLQVLKSRKSFIQMVLYGGAICTVHQALCWYFFRRPENAKNGLSQEIQIFCGNKGRLALYRQIRAYVEIIPCVHTFSDFWKCNIKPHRLYGNIKWATSRTKLDLQLKKIRIFKRRSNTP